MEVLVENKIWQYTNIDIIKQSLKSCVEWQLAKAHTSKYLS